MLRNRFWTKTASSAWNGRIWPPLGMGRTSRLENRSALLAFPRKSRRKRKAEGQISGRRPGNRRPSGSVPPRPHRKVKGESARRVHLLWRKAKMRCGRKKGRRLPPRGRPSRRAGRTSRGPNARSRNDSIRPCRCHVGERTDKRTSEQPDKRTSEQPDGRTSGQTSGQTGKRPPIARFFVRTSTPANGRSAPNRALGFGRTAWKNFQKQAPLGENTRRMKGNEPRCVAFLGPKQAIIGTLHKMANAELCRFHDEKGSGLYEIFPYIPSCLFALL